MDEGRIGKKEEGGATIITATIHTPLSLSLTYTHMTHITHITLTLTLTLTLTRTPTHAEDRGAEAAWHDLVAKVE